METFFSNSKREIAIIVGGSFLVAFVLSQIIRLKIEQMRRKSLLKRGLELEATVERLDKEMVDLTQKVRQLKVLDQQYSDELKKLTKKEPFITLKMLLFGFITLLLGVLIPLLLKVNING
jgi:hypothetical protein